MPKFRKKPVVVEAEQWFPDKDHKDVTGYYDENDVMSRVCEHCGNSMYNHGWIQTLEGGHIVCPGDWVITGVKGEKYPCKPDIFAMTYEPVLDG